MKPTIFPHVGNILAVLCLPTCQHDIHDRMKVYLKKKKSMQPAEIRPDGKLDAIWVDAIGVGHRTDRGLLNIGVFAEVCFD